MVRHRWPKGTWMRLKDGTLLRGYMNIRGASNADVAMAAGVGRTFISALVNGRRTSCTPQVAERIAAYFQMPVEGLFDPKTPTASSRNNGRQKVAA